MPADLALLSTLIGSNYPCLELIFMVPKVFEPLYVVFVFSVNYCLDLKVIGFTFRGSNSFGLIFAAFINSGANSYKKGIYDTSLNDTSSTELFGRKSCLSKCHFVEYRLHRNRFSSNTFDEIFYTHPAAILYLLIMRLHVIVRLRTLAKITESEPDCRFYKGARE